MTQSQHGHPYAYAPPAPARKARRWPWIVGIAVAFLVGTGVGGASDGDSSPAAVASSPQQAPAAPYVPAVVEPQIPEGSFGNGVYEVGTDIEPGKYLSPGAEPGSIMGCYIHIKDGDRYLEQKVVDEGQIRITVPESAQGAELDSRDCQSFTKVG